MKFLKVQFKFLCLKEGLYCSAIAKVIMARKKLAISSFLIRFQVLEF